MKIKDDSRKIEKGDIFVALVKNNDGHQYIYDAVNKGASKVIVNDSVIIESVNDTHEYLVNYLKLNYYDKIKHLKLIGMTGTNGKTTTCFLIYQALNNLGIKCAYIGTIGFYMDKKVKDLNNTTPDILEMYEMLLEVSSKNYEYVVLEASSQALDMHRLDGLKFTYAIFSNLTQDHLDYHHNMDNYIKAKQILFDNSLYRIINADDPYCSYFMNDSAITYGVNGKYKLGNFDVSINGSYFEVNDKKYYTSLIGKHNLYNLLAVITLLNVLNLDDDVSKLFPPKGRMDMVRKDSNLVIVDYAHTPDALSKIISTVRQLNPNKIITIIGCGGNRDKSKRPIMGKIATDLSNYVIFTNDNPRLEDEMSIISDITDDLSKNNYEIILNRKKAIIKGIQKLEKNDILLVLGKGHENYQIIGDKKYDFDDKQVVIDNI